MDNTTVAGLMQLNGGGLSLSSYSLAVGSMGGNAPINLNNQTLTAGSDGTNSTYAGALSGGGSLVKLGTGTLTLTGTSTYTGTTTINRGMLDIDGSLTSSAVMVNSSGTLSGTGSLASVTLEPGGQLAPGDSLGVMHLSGSLSLAAGAKVDYDLDENPADNEISMPAGLLALDDQQFSDFNFMFLNGFGRGTYTLIDAGSVSGQLGANVHGTIDGYPATLAVRGDNLVLIVPEPSTLALLAAGVLGLLGYGWRRRRRARRTAKAAFDQTDTPAILSFPSHSSPASAARRAA